MKLIPYTDLKSFFKTYLKAQSLLVCPNATVADSIRGYLQADIEVITWSRMLLNELERFRFKKKLKRKSELLIDFSHIFKKFFPDAVHLKFFQSYDLLSELRSFSLDRENFDEIFSEFPETVVRSTKIFWELLSSDDYDAIDEHGAYAFLEDCYATLQSMKSSQISFHQTYVFFGFNQLSGVQLDMLTMLSLQTEVIFPIHEKILENVSTYDWPSWVNLDREKKEDNEVLDAREEGKQKNGTVTEKSTEKIKVKRIQFSKNRLAESLALFKDENPSLFLGDVHVYLGNQNIKLNEILQIPLSHIHFSTTVDIFSIKAQELCDELAQKTAIYYKKAVFLDEFIQEVKNLLALLLNTKKRDDRKIKVLSLILNIVSLWQERSSLTKETTISFFEFEVFKATLFLSLPRLNVMPLNSNEVSRKLTGVSAWTSSEAHTVNILCVTSTDEDLLLGASPYSPNVLSTLSSIGPIKNKRFDFLLKSLGLLELLSLKNTYLFMEEDLEKMNLSWNDLKDKLDFEDVRLKNQKEREAKNPLSDLGQKKKCQLKSLSVTALKTYKNCPLSFYYKYIEPQRLDVKISKALRPFDLGNIEHEIISTYFNFAPNSFDEEILLKSARMTLIDYMKEKKVSLDSLKLRQAKLEVLTRSRRAIEILHLLSSSFKFEEEMHEVFNFKIEASEKSITKKGKIDCLAYNKDLETFGILDFKRSVTSSFAQINRFEDIQLLFYMTLFETKYKKAPDFLGYINLKKTEESCFLVFRRETFSHLTKIFEENFVKEFRPKVKEYSFETLVKNYRVEEKRLITKIFTCSSFDADPQRVDSCEYCMFSSICSKGVDL